MVQMVKNKMHALHRTIHDSSEWSRSRKHRIALMRVVCRALCILVACITYLYSLYSTIDYSFYFLMIDSIHSFVWLKFVDTFRRWITVRRISHIQSWFQSCTAYSDDFFFYASYYVVTSHLTVEIISHYGNNARIDTIGILVLPCTFQGDYYISIMVATNKATITDARPSHNHTVYIWKTIILFISHTYST